MSVTTILTISCAILSLQVRAVTTKPEFKSHSSGKGAFSWPKAVSINSNCNNERQPVVEFWHHNGVQYLFFSQRVTWEEARMMCLNYDARLAILDDMEKAVSIAKSIADSNIEMEDSWIGGRRMDYVWTWVGIDAGAGMKTEIPIDSNVENFPPWTRIPTRPTKECLAIDRRSHDHPNFIDLDCRLPRPIICEKNKDAVDSTPVPSKWTRIGRSTYTLYHGKVTWHEAAAFCRAYGTRLAILKTLTVINILTNSMTKTRPDFETVWIGAYFSYGQWTWMATGSILNPLRDDTGYPPWRFGRPEKNDGCLLLDRHIEDSTSFLETTCDRKRNFVCEEYPEDEDEDWLNEPLKFAHGNSTFIIYPVDRTWLESRLYCNERGSILASVENVETLNVIVEAMGDQSRGIHHVWLGGHFQSNTDAWLWVDSNEQISKLNKTAGFPPWARINTGLDHDPTSSSCLNLDRTDHVKPHFYGLDCASKQPFICKITCDVPPLVKHGSWNCYETTEGRECLLECDEDLMVSGVRNVTCTFLGGWRTGLHWQEFPLCIEPKEYTSRMVRSVSHDLQNSAGYYILIDHMAPAVRSLSLKFAERIVNAFPVSRTSQMGMACFTTFPSSHLSFNQTSTCEILEAIQAMKRNVDNSVGRKRDVDWFYNDVSMFNGRKIVILAIIDSDNTPYYADAIEQFKSSGHLITIIGLDEDWEMLLPLATVGFDRRKNLFLVNDVEMEKIIYELDGLHQTPLKCMNRTMDDNTVSTIMTPGITEILDVSTNSSITTSPDEIVPSDSEELINRRLNYPHGIPAVGISERRTINSGERSRVLADNDTYYIDHSTSSSGIMIHNSKSDQSIPKIYLEQGLKQNPARSQIPRQNIGAKDLSEEANVQEREKSIKATSSTNGPVENASDETASLADGNEGTK